MSDPVRISLEGEASVDPKAKTYPVEESSVSETGPAPSLPRQPEVNPDQWESGRQVGDFIIGKVLGKGSFGTVYLARQVSLDRAVALKTTSIRAASRSEGLALAGLEHDHIIQVFTEFSDPKSGRHCLALQYVPGADLAAVIQELHAAGARPHSGETVLKAIDHHVRGESRFDPRALRDRQDLAEGNFAQAVCRFGWQLAGALAYAHARGVLHCDVKPANILVTPYGKPMLADFNVSFDRQRRDPDDSSIGGTLAYMAPEHKAALYGDSDGPPVDERSDLYSLGVVLHEILTGKLPRPSEPESLDPFPRELAAVIRRCLSWEPAERYQTATELADALKAAWQLIHLRCSMPEPGRVSRWMLHRPYTAITVAAFLPHLFGSVLNIGYNTVEIQLTNPQRTAFQQITTVFNLLVYPLAVIVFVSLLRQIMRGIAALPRSDGTETDRLRTRVLHLGYWVMLIAVVGWLPGGVLFPFGIDLLSDESLAWQTYVHYAVSFTLSGLVGIVFSYLGVQWVVLRVLYPQLGNPDRFSPELAGQELAGPASLFVPFLTLASVVPLTGAVMLIVFASGELSLGFRLLVVGLIGMGMAGVSVAARLTNRLNELVAVWSRSTRSERTIRR